MKRKTLIGLLIGEGCLLLILAVAALGLNFGWFGEKEPDTALLTPDTEPSTSGTTEAATEATTGATTETTEPPTTEAPTTEPEPAEIIYELTFAGDCTLGTMYQYYSASSSFPAVVGDDFDYPFANVQDWFATDDFTMVNLEGPLTNDGTPQVKSFTFRGDPKFANVLTAGSVECVSLANNHARDFGVTGYENTEKALDGVGVSYAGDGESCFVETERGLKIGVFSVAFSVSTGYMADCIQDLRDQGAEIVIVSFHWGIEGYYRHTYDQESYAHAAIDAGADIIFGHHPHVLQEVEEYNGGIIYYSLGNFAFGGNSDPRDYDTALISQQVIRDVDGTVRLGECTMVPCSISSVNYPNNYQPTPAEEGTERYERAMEKLNGTYSGANLPLPDDDEEETEETTGETTEETAAANTEAAEAPPETTETQPEDTGETESTGDTGSTGETDND